MKIKDENSYGKPSGGKFLVGEFQEEQQSDKRIDGYN